MSITELVAKNKSLQYIDAKNGSSMSFNEILVNNPMLERPKSLVFLYVDNSLNSIIAFWNFVHSDHTIALLSPKMNPDHKENLEKLYSPYYIYDPTRTEIDTFKERPFVHGLSLFESETIPTYIIHPKVKILLSTSGTTGSPKFVKLSEENILQNALSIVDYLPIRSDDVTPLNLPIYYSYGLSVLTSNSLAGGIIIASNNDIMMKDFWKDFEKFGYTSLAGVPFVYEMLNRIGFTKKTYPSLRYLTQAGGRLNEKTVTFFADYCAEQDVSFYVMYGQTEATARMSFLAPNYVHKKPASIGKAIKNGKFMIDPETSELYYEGPNVFGGYASTYSDLDTFSDEQLLKTGDIARKDDDDFFYITGRLKRFVKLMGSRINLDEVEALLKNKFHGVTFVCIGLDDKKMLVGQVSGNVSHKTITDFLVAELKIHPTVLKIENIEEIPLTVNGKPDYNRIYETYKS
jgi:acyl-CoA synthetase (AMP-forming)/AMP-acid ligase II